MEYRIRPKTELYFCGKSNFMKENKYILLDVGGTSIKGFLANGTSGEILKHKEYPSKSGENAKSIFENFCNIVVDLKGEAEITAIGFAFPGPFDYKNGISLMKNIGKYDSIYGLSIEDELSKILPLFSGIKTIFLHDIEAFAIGCCDDNIERGICVCIGTGTGSAFIKNGNIIKESEFGVPENGWIFNKPYKDSIIDDYISARGLENLSLELLNRKDNGYELYQKCKSDDSNAVLVYKNFGEILLDCIKPFLEDFRPTELIFGGNIAKSFDYFGNAVRKYCDENNITVKVETDTSVKIMHGLIKCLDK